MAGGERWPPLRPGVLAGECGRGGAGCAELCRRGVVVVDAGLLLEDPGAVPEWCTAVVRACGGRRGEHEPGGGGEGRG